MQRHRRWHSLTKHWFLKKFRNCKGSPRGALQCGYSQIDCNAWYTICYLRMAHPGKCLLQFSCLVHRLCSLRAWLCVCVLPCSEELKHCWVAQFQNGWHTHESTANKATHEMGGCWDRSRSICSILQPVFKPFPPLPFFQSNGIS